MKILVTGGAGFIGSNIVDGYVRAGHEVLVVDNLSTGRISNLNPESRFFQVDIRSSEMDNLIRNEKPEILNHHAAQISVPASVSDPVLDADINIKGLLNLMESSVRHGVKKIIFVSSGGAIYGKADQYPTSEECVPQPLSPYAVSKYSSEKYLSYYKHNYGLDYIILRYANIYGPRQVPHGEAGVVAIFMDNLIGGKRSTLNHFPEDIEGMSRDYCYVDDVTSANLKALDFSGGDFFNIGTGIETKTAVLYRIIFEAFKEARDAPDKLAVPLRSPARPGDLKRSCLNVEKARHFLGWIPETGLKEGICKTLAWRLGQIK